MTTQHSETGPVVPFFTGLCVDWFWTRYAADQQYAWWRSRHPSDSTRLFPLDVDQDSTLDRITRLANEAVRPVLAGAA